MLLSPPPLSLWNAHITIVSVTFIGCKKQSLLYLICLTLYLGLEIRFNIYLSNIASNFFHFHRVYLTESGNPYTITVLRDQGTFGQEQVNYFVLTHTASLNDFNITGYDGGEETLVFANGVSKQTITIFVTNDNMPEGDETLTITLKGNTGKTVLGNPKILEVVIRANDDAYGVFNLSSSSVRKTIAEPGTGPVNEAEFVIVRGVETYGTVVVHWEVVNASSATDLSPVKGNVTFGDGDTQKTFKVTALLDSTPEKAETFIIRLSISGKLIF